jgi:hypothetical protein
MVYLIMPVFILVIKFSIDQIHGSDHLDKVLVILVKFLNKLHCSNRRHDIQHNNTQHNDIQHKDTQHKRLICNTQHK